MGTSDSRRPLPGHLHDAVGAVFDMLAATAPPPADGMMDLPPRKIPVPAGGWCAPDDMADLYSYAQRTRDALTEKLMFMDGMLDLPAPPSDEEVMRPIVEAAMRSIGMSVPLQPIIPTITRGRRHDGR